MHYLELIAKNKACIAAANEALKSKIKEVIKREEFAPGYPKWDGQFILKLPLKPGAQPGVTWCNEAADAIITEMGRDLRDIYDRKYWTIKWTDCDELYDHALELSKNPASNIQEVTPAQAWNLARNGVPVLAVAKSAGREVGHAGVVFPTEDPSDRRDPYIGQSGANPGIRRLSESFQKFGLSPKLFVSVRLKPNEKA